MNVLIVLAHPEPQSLNAHLANFAAETLREGGFDVECSDLYGMNFDPVEGPQHFSNRINAERFNAQAEQRHAFETHTLAADIQGEIEKLQRADAVIFQFPLWWFGMPAILKGWIDRVFVYGLYRSNQRFNQGVFAGKKVLISVTYGVPEQSVLYNGREGDADLILWPIHFRLYYMGFSVLPPLKVYGIRGGLQGEEADVLCAYVEDIKDEYRERLLAIDRTPALLFNKVDDFDIEGRLKLLAPVYSPFIRHRKHLDLA